jgi:hypothetical protein
MPSHSPAEQKKLKKQTKAGIKKETKPKQKSTNQTLAERMTS